LELKLNENNNAGKIFIPLCVQTKHIAIYHHQCKILTIHYKCYKVESADWFHLWEIVIVWNVLYQKWS
jgi:hypothetical protein